MFAATTVPDIGERRENRSRAFPERIFPDAGSDESEL